MGKLCYIDLVWLEYNRIGRKAQGEISLHQGEKKCKRRDNGKMKKAPSPRLFVV
jgi:hypothetical protein